MAGLSIRAPVFALDIETWHPSVPYPRTGPIQPLPIIIPTMHAGSHMPCMARPKSTAHSMHHTLDAVGSKRRQCRRATNWSR